MGHRALGMGHGAWGIGHWAWGMGHGALARAGHGHRALARAGHRTCPHTSPRLRTAIKLRVSAIKNVVTFLAVAIKLDAVRFIQSW